MASILGVTPARISQILRHEGAPSKDHRGRISVNAFVRFVQDTITQHMPDISSPAEPADAPKPSALAELLAFAEKDAFRKERAFKRWMPHVEHRTLAKAKAVLARAIADAAAQLAGNPAEEIAAILSRVVESAFASLYQKRK